MTKYDKEVDSRTPEYDKAIEPLEESTHEVRPPRDGQGDDQSDDASHGDEPRQL